MFGREFPDAKGRMPSAEVGEQIVRYQVETLGRIQSGLLAGYEPRSGWRAPSLERTAEMWDKFQRLTRPYWWCSLAFEEYGQGKLPKFPGWDNL